MTDSNVATQGSPDPEALRIDAASDSNAQVPWFASLRQTWHNDGPEPSLADFRHDPDEVLEWFTNNSDLLTTEEPS